MNTTENTKSAVLHTLENIIAPGGRVRVSPYVEAAQFQVIFDQMPEPTRRHESAQSILTKNAPTIEALAKVWIDFFRNGSNFSDPDTYTYDFLHAYLVYYFTTNVGKVQLSLLELIRQERLKGDVRIVDFGVGTATTLVAVADLLIAWAHVCDLYELEFPVKSVSFTGVDRMATCLNYSRAVALAFAGALSGPTRNMHRPVTEMVVQACHDAWWRQLDLNETTCDISSANLLVAGNILNELTNDGVANLNRTISLLPDGALALLIEPGKQDSAQKLMKWRRELVHQVPRVFPVGPCGAMLGKSLNAACDQCWNARRESLHQTSIYRTFRTQVDKYVPDRRSFSDFENNLLSWSYTFVQMNSTNEFAHVVRTLPEKAQPWPVDQPATYISRIRDLGDNQWHPVPHEPHKEAKEYLYLCAADFNLDRLLLRREPGVHVPPLRYGSTVKISGAVANGSTDAHLHEYILAPTPELRVEALEEKPTTYGTFLAGYSAQTENAVNELGYRLFGFPTMRDFQHKVLSRSLMGQNILAIAATGSGKSECYILPAMILPGVTIVISPLKSLMQDQYDQRLSKRYGLGPLSTYINGDVPFRDRQSRLKQMETGYYKLVYFTPEQLERSYILDSLVQTDKQVGIRFLALDEAHCISQWGHDFRSSYLNIVHRLRERGLDPIRIALTATASPRVRTDLCNELDLNPDLAENGGDLFIESSNRHELNLIVRVSSKSDEKVASILEDLQGLEGQNKNNAEPGAAIVFLPWTGQNPDYQTETDLNSGKGRYSAGVSSFASYLERKLQRRVAIYHGRMDDVADDEPDEQEPSTTFIGRGFGDLQGRGRRSEQIAFIEGQRLNGEACNIMVATKGFGMGIDKPNVRLVVHRTPPGNMEAYAQEAGRAGRDGHQANVVLYYSPDTPDDEDGLGGTRPVSSDHDIQSFFIAEKYVRREDVQVMRAFLLTVERGVQGQRYFTNDEAIHFFDRCVQSPELAALSNAYCWPGFPKRRQYTRETHEHTVLLDRGHQYQEKTNYLKRILDVLYRIRPQVGDTKLVFLESFQSCNAQVIAPRFVNEDAILNSNHYFGQVLRSQGIVKGDLQKYLREPTLLLLAHRLDQTLRETETMLRDIQSADGSLSKSGKWRSSLLEFRTIATPLFGPATGKDSLSDWRAYAGASRRASREAAHSRAKKARRPIRNGSPQTQLDDWFYWPELSTRQGWEVELGDALNEISYFADYLDAFMALHDDRQDQDWQDYHRLLTDYVSVNEDGKLREGKNKSCLREVLLGYLETYESVVGDSCYSCSTCVPDENFGKFSDEERQNAVKRLSPALEELLKRAKEHADQWPEPELIAQLVEIVVSEENSGRRVKAYLQGATGKWLQNEPHHIAAYWLRAKCMAEGIFELQPRQLIENIRVLMNSAQHTAHLTIVEQFITQLSPDLSQDPDFVELGAQIYEKLHLPDKETQAWLRYLDLLETQSGVAAQDKYNAHRRLAILFGEHGSSQNERALRYHQVMAARTSPVEEAARHYKEIISSLADDGMIEEEMAQTQVTHQPIVLACWLELDPTSRQAKTVALLEQHLNSSRSWRADDAGAVVDRINPKLLYEHLQFCKHLMNLLKQGSRSYAFLGIVVLAHEQSSDALVMQIASAIYAHIDTLESAQSVMADHSDAMYRLFVSLAEPLMDMAKLNKSESDTSQNLERFAQILLNGHELRDDVHRIWSRLSVHDRGSFRAYVNACNLEPNAQIWLDQSLESILSERLLQRLLEFHKDVPTPRWQLAGRMAKAIDNMVQLRLFNPSQTTSDDIWDLTRQFHYKRDPEEADMLVAALDTLRDVCNKAWLTPLARQIEVLVHAGRSEDALALEQQHKGHAITIGRDRVSVKDYIAQVHQPIRNEPMNPDYKRIAEIFFRS